MGPRKRPHCPGHLLALLLVASLARAATAEVVTVATGYELHAALASPTITEIYLTHNVSPTAAI